MKVHKGLVHLTGHLLAAIDIETTGKIPGHHEIIQIAIQPLNAQIEPLEGVTPFIHYIKPEHDDRVDKEATAVHKLSIDWLINNAADKWTVEELLTEWWYQLKLPHLKTIVPLAQNWQFEAGFLKAWLGVDQFHHFFHSHVRDTMHTALFINDLHYMHGHSVPFRYVNLSSLCRKFNVVNTNPHDALSDARAEAEVYKHMVTTDWPI